MTERRKILDQINHDYDEFIKELDIRDKKLKNVVYFNNDDEIDDLLNLLDEGSFVLL